MTLHRATYDRPGWSVIRSEDGGRHWTTVTSMPTAKAARAFIDSIEGRLRPTRSEHQAEVSVGASFGTGAHSESTGTPPTGVGSLIER